ncbi:hypothetical protein ZOSMA_24G01230 [Zostera marina]|uniref:Glycine-rich protein n=1 Tax=Zostera marina TaxID=29655 RepID=A0A0K9PIQ3_ZOSMR|nr:hypothetical protein ZOSMA_24G01230 [Zostera marina]
MTSPRSCSRLAVSILILLLALTTGGSAGRDIPIANAGKGVEEEKSVFTYAGLGGYNGVGSSGHPFGGVGAGVGAAGDMGGLDGLGGLGAVNGGLGGLPGLDGSTGLGGLGGGMPLGGLGGLGGGLGGLGGGLGGAGVP